MLPFVLGKAARCVVSAVLIGTSAPILAVAGASALLSAVGFGVTGVVSGSIAATVQSVFYGPATCGVFSLLQWAGATVAAPAATQVFAALGAVAAGIAGALL